MCVVRQSRPALLNLRIALRRTKRQAALFLVLVVQPSDILQYAWGKCLGKEDRAQYKPQQNVEGFIGGIGCATLIGASLWWLRPSSVAGGGMSLLITSWIWRLAMSAIKRDRVEGLRHADRGAWRSAGPH